MINIIHCTVDTKGSFEAEVVNQYIFSRQVRCIMQKISVLPSKNVSFSDQQINSDLKVPIVVYYLMSINNYLIVNFIFLQLENQTKRNIKRF